MTMQLHFWAGILFIALSIPLIFRKVPMNHFYGVRTPKAFASEHNWYEINEYGGKLFLVYGLFLCAFGLMSSRLAPALTSPWFPVFITVPLLLIIPIFLLIRSFGRRLPDR